MPVTERQRALNRRHKRRHMGWPEEYLDLPPRCKPPKSPQDEQQFASVMVKMIPLILMRGGDLERRITTLERRRR